MEFLRADQEPLLPETSGKGGTFGGVLGRGSGQTPIDVLGNYIIHVDSSAEKSQRKRIKVGSFQIRLRNQNGGKTGNSDSAFTILVLSVPVHQISRLITQFVGHYGGICGSAIRLERSSIKKGGRVVDSNLLPSESTDFGDGSGDDFNAPTNQKLITRSRSSQLASGTKLPEKDFLKNAISVIPDSTSADQLISCYSLQQRTVEGIPFFSGAEITLVVFRFGDTSKIPTILSYFPPHKEIILITPVRSRYGITKEIFSKIRQKVPEKEHSFKETSCKN